MVDEDLLAETTDELYAVDPADFVAARTDLVRRLKSEGQKELAVEVGKLRRPSPAAWAVNQLVRRDPQGVEELLRRGEELRDAQDLALAGAHADDLREAARARRDAVAALTDAALGYLAERGASADAHRQQIEATLEAATLDPEAGAAVQAGRMSAALEPPSGFGDLAVLMTAPVEKPDRAATEARRRAKELAGKARVQAEKVARLSRELGEADAEVAARERRLEEARQRRNELAERLAAAEEAAARAEAEAAAVQP